LAFAKWITDPENPLSARVAVNHIWLRHFGQPLVENIDDFGLRSLEPPLADLLDYLAVELMEHGWSMKHVHRMIVSSNAYRSSSSARGAAPRNMELDPDNRNFWRMNPRRLEAEAIRDTLLYVAGSLDFKQGGPDIDHQKGFAVPRRSLYFRHARERQMEFLTLFDLANPNECYRRQESVRPQQAFALVNSSLALAQSRKLASHLMADETTSDEVAFITSAFETILSRSPSENELKECREFLTLQARQLADPTKLNPLANSGDAVPASTDPVQRARENLILVLFNHNDFVTIR
jgi:hypothetical protein